MSLRVIHPDGWAPARGYANGILAPDGTLHVGGQIGWTAAQVFEASDFCGQMEQALANIRAVVEAAGGTPADIARLTWFVTDKREYLARQREIGDAYRRRHGPAFPGNVGGRRRRPDRGCRAGRDRSHRRDRRRRDMNPAGPG